LIPNVIQGVGNVGSFLLTGAGNVASGAFAVASAPISTVNRMLFFLMSIDFVLYIQTKTSFFRELRLNQVLQVFKHVGFICFYNFRESAESNQRI
jgi:hypothetical protein